ncbi:DUF6458 family protein [Parafrankia sp. EUN1f]|uniref:DUF6458 family protein n=2 Tax=Parafrankia sp. EUN1f TaxID=102897 RepID=UPI0001C47479|nr:DUF6458 family protein [Parafrankia sp. EUN1f]EFC79987.1 hypothetical protein FrEUN1fDRAFT_6881 [Parafrankia sp. EUN1f]
MTTGFSIFLLAAGAILRFALSYRVNGVDLHALGSIIMATGAATLFVCFIRDLRTARRRRPAPVARTLPLGTLIPPEDGTAEWNWPAAESARSADRDGPGFRLAGDGTSSWHTPRPGIPRPWEDTGHPGYATDACPGEGAGDWPEGGSTSDAWSHQR